MRPFTVVFVCYLFIQCCYLLVANMCYLFVCCCLLLLITCYPVLCFSFFVCPLILLPCTDIGFCKLQIVLPFYCYCFLIVLGFNDTSTHVGHFVSSPREREKRDRRNSTRGEREGQGRKKNRNESEETEEIKTFPFYPYLLQG